MSTQQDLEDTMNTTEPDPKFPKLEPHFTPFYSQYEIEQQITNRVNEELAKLAKTQPTIVNNITVCGQSCCCSCKPTKKPPARAVLSVTQTGDPDMPTIPFKALITPPDPAYAVNRTMLTVVDAQGTREIELPAGAESAEFECQSEPNSEASCFVQDFNILGAGVVGPPTFFDISAPAGVPPARTVFSVQRAPTTPTAKGEGSSGKRRFVKVGAVLLACAMFLGLSGTAAAQCQSGVSTTVFVPARTQTVTKTVYTAQGTFRIESIEPAPYEIRTFTVQSAPQVFVQTFPSVTTTTERRGLFGRRSVTTTTTR